MLSYILFFLWFPLLIKWADILVSWASNIALRYGIPSLVVGLTIVAFGTSAPELAVNIFSALKGNTELVMGNILWSNISNLLLILWVTAIIITLPAQNSTLRYEIPFSLITVLLIGIFWLLWEAVSFFAASIFLWLFAGFMYYNYHLAKKWWSRLELPLEDEKSQDSLIKNIIFIFLWLGALVIGWKWIVDGAVVIAQSLGMSELVVGLTIVAIGTSLPELATSVIAALKWESDIAIWNVIGSNIFNVLLVLWVSGLIHDIVIEWEIYRDIAVNIWATLLLLIFLLTSKKHSLMRWHWAIFVSLFMLYLWYLLLISLV